MADTSYVLDLIVTGADLVTMIDDGVGNDTISVLGTYEKPVEITLRALLTQEQTSRGSAALYYDMLGKPRELLIFGVVENATGSRGRDVITGNELANRLDGEVDMDGPGAADTIRGMAGNDTLMGGVGADVLSGDEDDDLLMGHSGLDLLLGGTGRDTLIGGSGADELDGGGQAGDCVSYAGSTGGVRLVLLAGGGAGSGGDADGDTLRGVTDIVGSSLRDILTDGEAGVLAGGANANHFAGFGGGDLLSLGGGADTGEGGLGNDVLRGGAWDDLLFGGNGADRLNGQAGADVLTGGLGADRFVFERPTDSGQAGADLITDFDVMERDLIDLRRIDADAGMARNQAFVLAAGGFTGQAGELVQRVQDGALWIEADLNGDGQADFWLRLAGSNVLEASSFLL